MGNFQRIITFYSKSCPGSGKTLFRLPDPGVKKAPDPRSGSAKLGSALVWLFGFRIRMGNVNPDVDLGSKEQKLTKINHLKHFLILFLVPNFLGMF